MKSHHSLGLHLISIKVSVLNIQDYQDSDKHNQDFEDKKNKGLLSDSG